MTQERIEAAADAVMDAAFGQELPEAPYDLANAALAAADAVMFSDEAVERAAASVSKDFPWYGNYSPTIVQNHVREVIAALKGDA